MERQEIIDGLVEILKTVRTIDQEKLQKHNRRDRFHRGPQNPVNRNDQYRCESESKKFDVEFEDDDIDDLGSTVKDIVDLIIRTKERA